MADITYVEGETRPLRARIKVKGEPYDLHNVSNVQLVIRDTDEIVVKGNARMDDRENGIVEYQWRPEVPPVGFYEGRFIVRTLNGDSIKVPTGQPFSIMVERD